MIYVLIWILLACVNLPFMLDNKCKTRVLNSVAFGINIGLAISYAITHLIK